MNRPPLPLSTYEEQDDRSPLRHLGLPFYFRHTPPPPVRRAVFWLSFLIVIGLFLYNAVLMPSEPGSFLHALRRSSFFSSFRGYATFEQGMVSLFNQGFVLALLVSGLVAPLYATFSLCGERVTGTMEFLRLAPFSAPGIVVGKLFAAAHLLHVFSGLLLGLGSVCGVLGGLELGKVGLALLAAVLGCATLHALGGFFACLTLALRGFGAVLGFLFLGWIFCHAPVAFWDVPNLGFLSSISPWGALDALFWHEANARNRYVEMQFFGAASLVPLYLIVFHGLFFTLLVWGAARRLETPERTILPPAGWLLLWGFVLLTALGAVWNDPAAGGGRSYPGQEIVWTVGAVVMLFAGAAVCLLSLLDHPYRREKVLAAECERLAGRGRGGRQGWRRWMHAGFVTGLVLLTGLLVGLMFHGRQTMLQLNAPAPSAQEWSLAHSMLVTLAVVFFALQAVLILETVSLRFVSPSGRGTFGVLALGILLAAFLAPLIHAGMAYGNWQTTVYYREVEIRLEDPKYDPYGGALRGQNYTPIQLAQFRSQYERSIRDNINRFRQHWDYDLYTEGVTTLEDISELRAEFSGWPYQIFWRYHRQAALTYPCLVAVLFLALLAWRFSTYRVLTREAEKAFKGTAGRPEGSLFVPIPGKVVGIAVQGSKNIT